MTTKDEALKQALEALEEIHPGNMTPIAEKTWDTAITALREALAQTDEQEPVAEITADDMGRPFNAIRIGAYFYKEIPPVGTKLYIAPPERQPHNLNSTVFVYRNRETGAIKALYTEGARAMTGRDDYEHVASLEPRMWIEHHFDDAAKERQPLTDAQRYALIEKHLGLEQRKNATVIDHRTGRWTDAARYFDLMDAAIVTAEATGEQP